MIASTFTLVLNMMIAMYGIMTSHMTGLTADATSSWRDTSEASAA